MGWQVALRNAGISGGHPVAMKAQGYLYKLRSFNASRLGPLSPTSNRSPIGVLAFDPEHVQVKGTIQSSHRHPGQTLHRSQPTEREYSLTQGVP